MSPCRSVPQPRDLRDGSAKDGIAGTTMAAAALAFFGGGFESALAAALCTCCSRRARTYIALPCNSHTQRTYMGPSPSPPQSSSRLGLLPQSLALPAGSPFLEAACPLACPLGRRHTWHLGRVIAALRTVRTLVFLLLLCLLFALRLVYLLVLCPRYQRRTRHVGVAPPPWFRPQQLIEVRSVLLLLFQI